MSDRPRPTDFCLREQTDPTDPFDVLLESYRSYLLAIANREVDSELLPKGGASDLVQETLAAAHRRRDQFRGRSPAELAAWLRAILQRRIGHFRRRFRGAARRDLRREVPFGALPENPGPLAYEAAPCEQLERQEEVDRLLGAVGQLPADQRRVVVLRSQWGLSFREIGEKLGRTEDAARMLWARALTALRRELARPAG